MAELTEDDIEKLPPEKQAIARSLLEARKRKAAGLPTTRQGAALKQFDAPQESDFVQDVLDNLQFKPGTMAHSFSRGLAEGGTLNFGNEISGVLGAADEVARRARLPKQIAEYIPKSVADFSKDTGAFPGDTLADRITKRYGLESGDWKKETQAAQAANPGSYLVGELTSAFAAPVPGAGAVGGLAEKGVAKVVANAAAKNATKKVAQLAPRVGPRGASILSELGTRGVEDTAKTAGKYAKLATEGAITGGVGGFGAGEGLQGSIETGFYGMGLGAAAAPALVAGGGKGWDSTKRLVGQTGATLQDMAEEEVLRAGLGKAQISEIPADQRRELGRELLNVRVGERGEKYGIQPWDNAEKMIGRLEPAMRKAGQTGDELLYRGDKSIAEELGLPDTSPESIRRLRALFKDADALRVNRAKIAEQETAHAAEAGEKRRLVNWNEETKRAHDDQDMAWSVMDRSAREKDDAFQNQWGEDLAALRKKPESKKVGFREFPGLGSESIENQLSRLRIARKSLMQKLRNTMKGKWADGTDDIAAKADDDAAKGLVDELSDSADDLAEEAVPLGRKTSVRSAFGDDEAKDIIEALKNVPADERAAAIRNLANQLIKTNDPRVSFLPFKAGRVGHFPGQIRGMVDLSPSKARDYVNDYVQSKRFWHDPDSVQVAAANRKGDTDWANVRDRINFENRALSESGRHPMVWDTEVQAGMSTGGPAPRVEPNEFSVDPDFSLNPDFIDGSPRLREGMTDSPMTAVPAQDPYVPFWKRTTPARPDPEIPTGRQAAPEVNEPKLLTQQQIDKQAREFGESRVPNVRVESDPNLLKGIGVDVGPTVNEVGAKLNALIKAPNLQVTQKGKVNALMKEWEKIADQGTTLQELREFKTRADEDLAKMVETGIDQRMVLAVRGAIDDLVERELEKATNPTMASAYKNSKRTYGALAQFLGGLDNRFAGDLGNSRASLSDNIRGVTAGAAAGAKNAENGGLLSWLAGVPVADTAMALNKQWRQRSASTLARGEDALGRKLEDTAALMTPSAKDATARLFNTGRTPGASLLNMHLEATGDESAAQERVQNSTRSNKVQALLQKNPNALGAAGPALQAAIQRDIAAGNTDNKELKAAIFLNKGKLPSDQELDKLLRGSP